MASLYKHRMKDKTKVFVSSFVIKYIWKRICQNFLPPKNYVILLCILLPYDINFGGRKFWQNSSRQSLTDNILANAQNCHKVPKIIMR